MNLHSRREMLAASGLALLARRLRAMPLADIKLGITTDEIDDDVLTAAKFLSEHHLKWAEVRNIWGKYNTDQPMDKIKDARAILDERGVKVSIEGTGFFKIPLPPETSAGQARLDKEWELLDRSFERAKAFGTNKLRIFTFMLGRGEQTTAAGYERIYELTREAARRAKRAGCLLAVETIGGGWVGTGAQAGDLLKQVKEDALGITWDPNNAAQGGETPFPDGYRKMEPARIFHVHLRDYKHEDGKVVWAAVGDGEFDNVAQIRALLKDGYKGTFTLETHWRDPKDKRPVHATEISLAGMMKVIEKV
jgi:sugar phosphate isomerase/epimerase